MGRRGRGRRARRDARTRGNGGVEQRQTVSDAVRAPASTLAPTAAVADAVPPRQLRRPQRGGAAGIGLATVGIATLVALTGATDDRSVADGTPRGRAAAHGASSTPTPRGPWRSAPEASRTLRAHERALLRSVFGIDDADRLYASDSTADAVLLYRAVPTGCVDGGANPRRSTRVCRPVPVRVGLTSPRRPDETWDAFVARVARRGPRAWPGAVHSYYTSLASLDPDARPRFERLVADARRAGFRVRVAETYRSPERQALLLARGDGRTATATSVHSYGRAADLIIGDGRFDRASTARTWIRFRRWVVRYDGGVFRLVGTPERTWDWPHVELAEPLLGYSDAETLVAAARRCRAAVPDHEAAAARCTLVPRLPAHVPPQGAPRVVVRGDSANAIVDDATSCGDGRRVARTHTATCGQRAVEALPRAGAPVRRRMWARPAYLVPSVASGTVRARRHSALGEQRRGPTTVTREDRRGGADERCAPGTATG